MRTKGWAHSIRYIPSEIIFEILTWLPVEALLRFKVVCKLWKSIINEPMFVEKHMRRAKYVLVYTITDKSLNTSNPSNEAVFVGHLHGLELQQGFVSKKYRLRNPCTRQYLDLPDPCGGMIGRLKMSYIPSTREFKLVHSYVEENSYIIGCKILTAGTDAEWRSIDLPSPYQWSDFSIDYRVIDHICYIIFSPKSHMDSCPKVACLDMQNEQFFLVDIPWTFFSGWEPIMLLEWYGKLSIAAYLQDELHFWVLESYQNPKWSGKNMIKGLKQSKKHQGWLAGFLQGDNTNQVMVNLKDEEMISMHPSSGKTLIKVALKGYTFLYRREPSLIHIRGMQPECF